MTVTELNSELTLCNETVELETFKLLVLALDFYTELENIMTRFWQWNNVIWRNIDLYSN